MCLFTIAGSFWLEYVCDNLVISDFFLCFKVHWMKSAFGTLKISYFCALKLKASSYIGPLFFVIDMSFIFTWNCVAHLILIDFLDCWFLYSIQHFPCWNQLSLYWYDEWRFNIQTGQFGPNFEWFDLVELDFIKRKCNTPNCFFVPSQPPLCLYFN